MSGTSALLATVVGESGGTYVLCEGRSCVDVLDLAMAIGDAVVKTLPPAAEDWWAGTAAPASTAGLRVARAVSVQGIDLQKAAARERKGSVFFPMRSSCSLL